LAWSVSEDTSPQESTHTDEATGRQEVDYSTTNLQQGKDAMPVSFNQNCLHLTS